MMTDTREFRLPTSFFAENRRKLLQRLPDDVLVVLFAGKAVTMSSDSEYPFFANRNFYYSTGVEQEQSILVLLRQAGSVSETLFIQTQDPLWERWTGKRMTRDAAGELSGVEDVRFLPEFEDYINPILQDHSLSVAIEEGSHTGPGKEFEKLILSLEGERETVSLAPVFARIRMIKEPCELDMIRHAIRLTHEAVEETVRHIRPGVTELMLTSAFQFALNLRGCLISAFPPIFAAAENALCLHHMKPIGRANEGDLIQIDVGGRVAGLCADISRVFPANGTFTDRQKALYEAVRACQETCFRSIRPGKLLSEINEETKRSSREELRKLSLLSDDPSDLREVSDYYWHNASHHLGHDVHDVCVRELPLQEGMVITVEPGLYVEEWGIGFRIEDDVVVTSEGCEILSDFFPREADEICQMFSDAERGD